jgi:hypothetical protein
MSVAGCMPVTSRRAASLEGGRFREERTRKANSACSIRVSIPVLCDLADPEEAAFRKFRVVSQAGIPVSEAVIFRKPLLRRVRCQGGLLAARLRCLWPDNVCVHRTRSVFRRLLAASSGHFEIDLVFCSVDWAARHREPLRLAISRLQHATAWTTRCCEPQLPDPCVR